MPTGMHCPLMGVQSHDDGRCGRSATEVHGPGSVTGVQSKCVLGLQNQWAQKLDGGMASRLTRMYGVFLSIGNVITKNLPTRS